MARSTHVATVLSVLLFALALAPIATPEGALRGHDSGCYVNGAQRSCWTADTVAHWTLTPSGVWNYTFHSVNEWTYGTVAGEFWGTSRGVYTQVVHDSDVTVSHTISRNVVQLFGQFCTQTLNVQVVDGVIRHQVDIRDCRD